MADDQKGSGAEVDGIGAWETIATVIMIAVFSAAVGIFAYGLTSHGISH